MTELEEQTTEQLRECPLCTSSSWRVLPVPGHWIGGEIFGDLKGKIGLVKCRQCQLVFANPRPSSARLSEFYDGDTYCCHEVAGSASAGAKADFLLQRIAQCLPADAPRTLLDYGAGGGGFLKRARDQDWQVRGFEPGKRGLHACKSAGLPVTDRVDELPAGEFGLVTLHHVFEHLANPIEVLAGIRPLLAPNGCVFIEVPNSRSLRARLSVPYLSRHGGADERYRAFPIHLMYYSQSTLRRMIQKAGWVTKQSFTAGMGLDEFFIRSTESGTLHQDESRTEGTQSPGKRRIRHQLRDAFLNLGLGENVAVIAQPVIAQPDCNS